LRKGIDKMAIPALPAALRTAVLSRRVEEAKKKMLEAGAISQGTAKTATELGVEKRHLQSRLAKHRGIIETSDRKYYVKTTA
jgi:hypothetical protein